jgi:PKD repeat protein
MQQAGWSLSTDSYVYNIGDIVTFIVTKPETAPGGGTCITEIQYYIVVTLPDGTQSQIGPIGFPQDAGTYYEQAGQAGPPPGTRYAELLGQGMACVTPEPSPEMYASTSYVVQGSYTTTTTSQLQASSSCSPNSGNVPLTVSCTSSASGGTPPYTYNWSFGDGGSSNDANPSHTYTSPGNYQITFTVTDSNGATSSNSISVTVSQALPSLTVDFVNVLDSAQSLLDLGGLIVTHGTTLDDIVTVTSVSDQTLQDATLNYSPSSELVVIRNDKYTGPLHWIFEVKSPALKDFLGDLVLTLSIMTVCAAAGLLPPPIDAITLEACAKSAEVAAIFSGGELGKWLSNLQTIWSILDPPINLDSISVVLADGSTATIPSSSLQASTLQFPTILGTINRLLSQGNWWGQIITIHSPVTLLITDSSGRQVGQTASGQIINEIPGALFASPDLVYLPSNIASYNVQLTGTGEGSYGLDVTLATSTIDNQAFSGSISTGQTVAYAVTKSNNQLTVSQNGPDFTSWIIVGLIAVILVVGGTIFYRKRGRRIEWNIGNRQRTGQKGDVEW